MDKIILFLVKSDNLPKIGFGCCVLNSALLITASSEAGYISPFKTALSIILRYQSIFGFSFYMGTRTQITGSLAEFQKFVYCTSGAILMVESVSVLCSVLGMVLPGKAVVRSIVGMLGSTALILAGKRVFNHAALNKQVIEYQKPLVEYISQYFQKNTAPPQSPKAEASGSSD